MKAKETGDPNAQIHLWDWRYYANQLKKEKYTVDEEALRVYFPYQNVLDGMFRIYQRIFGLKFQRIEPPYKWVADLQLYAVSDAATGEPLGLFYLDMFPREGKYNHFAEFSLIDGKLLADGKYQRPTVALICNFPSPENGRPSLLAHEDVVTIFHEFGHAMHSHFDPRQIRPLLRHERAGRFRRGALANAGELGLGQKGAGQLRRRLSRPVQENPRRNPGQAQGGQAGDGGQCVTAGNSPSAWRTWPCTRKSTPATRSETVPLSNKIAGETFFPEPPDTAFVAYFGHLMGYDAGYYGYAWADAIAADMATVFATRARRIL